MSGVTKATYSTGESISYSYDAGGNLLKVVFNNPNKAKDSDGDGYSDDKDAFPNDPNEWLDTDGDGLGNNADTDDDNDGISDKDEIKYGLNPLDPNDATVDNDGDGVSNIDEIKAGTNPNKIDNKTVSSSIEVYFGKDQRVLAGEEANITILLDKKLKNYPANLLVKISDESTLGDKDYRIKEGLNFIVSNKTKLTRIIKFSENAVCDDEMGSMLVVEFNELDESKFKTISAKRKQRFYVVCHKELRANIEVRQQNKQVSIVHNTSIPINIIAKVNNNDLNYDWSDSDPQLLSYISSEDLSLKSIKLTLNGIKDGAYDIVLKVMDKNSEELLIIKRKLIIKQNGSYIDIDEDGDGISDVFDHIKEPNILQTEHLNETNYLIKARDGEKLELGDIAKEQMNQGALIDASKLPIKEGYRVEEVFDFKVTGLEKGGVAKVVIPLKKPIEKDAVYLKYSQDNGWRDFAINNKNRVESSQEIDKGICPNVGSSSYEIGLIAGYHCIQLTIEDGGANDNDHLVNGEILDPSGVANKIDKTDDDSSNGNTDSSSKPDDSKSVSKKSSGGGGGALGYILPLLLLFVMFARKND